MTTTRIPIAFAQDGTRTAIDLTRPDGIVNLTQGYTDDYSRQLGSDPAAKAIERDRMNWLFNVITSNIMDWQQSAVPQWLAQADYDVPALVRFAPSGNTENLYRAIVKPPQGTVPTNTQYWEEVLSHTALLARIPMPYRGITTTSTNFNSYVTNGTWVMSAANVATYPNAPGNAVSGMLEVRLTTDDAQALVQRYTDVNGGIYTRGRTSGGTWTAWITSTYPVPVSQGGTGATTAAQARANLGLGTAATYNVGTAGATVPLLNTANTWTAHQTIGGTSGTLQLTGAGGPERGSIVFGTNGSYINYNGGGLNYYNGANGVVTSIDGGGVTWTTGNFDPGSKVSKSGDTMTGGLNIQNNTVRLNGWGGNAGNGVVYFGPGESYLFKSGNTFELRNGDGGFSVNFVRGGNALTSLGDQAINTGTLRISPNGNDQLFMRSNGSTGVGIDAVNSTNAAYAPLSLRGSTVNLNGPVHTSSTATVNGEIVSLNTGITSRGSGAGFALVERTDFGVSWSMYASAGSYRIWNSLQGDSMTVERNGNVRATGNLYGASITTPGSLVCAGIGTFAQATVTMNGGTDVNAGYVAFHTTNGTRRGYIGWNDGANRLQYSVENGFTGHSFLGNVIAAGGFDIGSSRKLKIVDGPLQYGLREVRRVATLIGRYKPEYNDDGRTRLFFDADQFAAIMPEAVDLKGEVFEGEQVATMKIDQTLPPLYNAVAELADQTDDRIEQLERDNRRLEELVDRLESRLSALEGGA